MLMNRRFTRDKPYTSTIYQLSTHVAMLYVSQNQEGTEKGHHLTKFSSCYVISVALCTTIATAF